MCGLCGWVDDRTKDDFEVEGTIRRMVESIHHRGPDHQDWCRQGEAVLGHARLSILDLSTAGHQPMRDASVPVVIVLNGEIYNFHEIRTILEDDGVDFRSHSDTEVALQAYLRWGLDAFSRFNGIFAAAIWDGRERRLVLARDRLGVKPLYWAVSKNRFIFGSEIKAILASGEVDPQVDAECLDEILWFGGAGLGSNTLFSGIKKLLPGHYGLWEKGQFTEKSFWEARMIEANKNSLSENADRLQQLCGEAVQRQLVSDVPVGAFLSGGIDSSAVVAFASRHSGNKIRTFSAGFDYEQGGDEREKARKVAEYFDTEHQEMYISGGSIRSLLDTLVWHHDEPFGDAANIPLFLMSRELGGEPKVILQGDGGDEMFAGYRRYSLLDKASYWKALSKLRFLFKWCEHGAGWRFRRILNAFARRDEGERMALLLTLETEGFAPESVLANPWQKRLRDVDPFTRYRDFNVRFEDQDPVQRMLWTDAHILLPDDFLEKVDKSTMANGIEVRVPFLDNEIVDFALGLPSRQKVRGKEKKYLLKMALRGIVPDWVLDAPKTGFGVPYGQWLRNDLAEYAEEVFYDPGNAEFLNRTTIERLVKENVEKNGRYDFLLWKVLNLGIWYRRYCVDKRFSR